MGFYLVNSERRDYISDAYLRYMLLQNDKLPKNVSSELHATDVLILNKLRVNIESLSVNDLVDNFLNNASEDELNKLAVILNFSKPYILAILYLYKEKRITVDDIDNIINATSYEKRSEIILSRLLDPEEETTYDIMTPLYYKIASMSNIKNVGEVNSGDVKKVHKENLLTEFTRDIIETSFGHYLFSRRMLTNEKDLFKTCNKFKEYNDINEKISSDYFHYKPFKSFLISGNIQTSKPYRFYTTSAASLKLTSDSLAKGKLNNSEYTDVIESDYWFSRFVKNSEFNKLKDPYFKKRDKVTAKNIFNYKKSYIDLNCIECDVISNILMETVVNKFNNRLKLPNQYVSDRNYIKDSNISRYVLNSFRTHYNYGIHSEGYEIEVTPPTIFGTDFKDLFYIDKIEPTKYEGANGSNSWDIFLKYRSGNSEAVLKNTLRILFVGDSNYDERGYILVGDYRTNITKLALNIDFDINKPYLSQYLNISASNDGKKIVIKKQHNAGNFYDNVPFFYTGVNGDQYLYYYDEIVGTYARSDYKLDGNREIIVGTDIYNNPHYCLSNTKSGEYTSFNSVDIVEKLEINLDTVLENIYNNIFIRKTDNNVYYLESVDMSMRTDGKNGEIFTLFNVQLNGSSDISIETSDEEGNTLYHPLISIGGNGDETKVKNSFSIARNLMLDNQNYSYYYDFTDENKNKLEYTSISNKSTDETHPLTENINLYTELSNKISGVADDEEFFKKYFSKFLNTDGTEFLDNYHFCKNLLTLPDIAFDNIYDILLSEINRIYGTLDDYKKSACLNNIFDLIMSGELSFNLEIPNNPGNAFGLENNIMINNDTLVNDEKIIINFGRCDIRKYIKDIINNCDVPTVYDRYDLETNARAYIERIYSGVEAVDVNNIIMSGSDVFFKKIAKSIILNYLRYLLNDNQKDVSEVPNDVFELSASDFIIYKTLFIIRHSILEIKNIMEQVYNNTTFKYIANLEFGCNSGILKMRDFYKKYKSLSSEIEKGDGRYDNILFVMSYLDLNNRK